MLKFSAANSKLKGLYNVKQLQPYLQNARKVYSFDLLSGWSCPFASDCLSKVYEIGGKRTIKDGKNCQFRCFSASQEVVFPNTYNRRKENFDTIKRAVDYMHMANMIDEVVPNNLGVCRIHVGGDFFSKQYMRAWTVIANWYPDRLFYAYTKSLQYWLDLQDELGYKWPENLILTASRGGRLDHLIDQHGLREAVVVFSEDEAAALEYEIDHNDSHAARPDIASQNFALLIHGVQPKGSEASEAVKQLKKSGTKFEYGKASPHAVGV